MTKVFLLLICLITVITSFTFSPGGHILQDPGKGKEVYILYCQSCHMEKGEGVEGIYPPLAKTIYLKDTKKIISVILEGQSGEVTVNGKTYNAIMPPQPYLTDEQIADVLTYIRKNWGNKYPAVKPAQVKLLRK